MEMKHHAYIYSMYLSNPALPVHGYTEELYRNFGLIVSYGVIERWFLMIGLFKGMMRLISKFLSGGINGQPIGC